MKTLILVRHGKSSWDYSVSDKDRPLKERGINDAHLVGHHFEIGDSGIDAAFSSPACRAMHTAMIVLRELKFPLEKFLVTEELYDFSGSSVSNFVRNLDDTINKVIIFGHNYAFTNIANSWGNQSVDNVPTAGLVEINFNTNHWSSLQKGITKSLLFPKQLR